MQSQERRTRDMRIWANSAHYPSWEAEWVAAFGLGDNSGGDGGVIPLAAISRLSPSSRRPPALCIAPELAPLKSCDILCAISSFTYYYYYYYYRIFILNQSNNSFHRLRYIPEQKIKHTGWIDLLQDRLRYLTEKSVKDSFSTYRSESRQLGKVKWTNASCLWDAQRAKGNCFMVLQQPSVINATTQCEQFTTRKAHKLWDWGRRCASKFL